MIRETWKLSVIRENVETECVIRGNVETECDQGKETWKRGTECDQEETWKLSEIRGNVETECDQGKRGN